jgi:NAD(P)-dependent dehydrogenase (short-subunit alcohol dehydrogenase family)
MHMLDLAGKVAVVTGGASGIGRGLCETFAQAGLAVVVADIDADGARSVASALREGGARAHAAAVDVADAESVEALAAASFDEFGAVHVVCNNAGVIVGGSLQEATDSDWRWMLDVNLGGVIHGCRAFAPRLIAQGQGGHIVNTASVGGFLAGPGLGVYCTTKFAVIGFTDALRAELAPAGIGVSALCPGGVRTRLLDADRNRPVALAESGGRAEALRAAIEAGIDPAEVGRHVLRGIEANADFIFTQPGYRDPIERRFRAVLSAFDDVSDG